MKVLVVGGAGYVGTILRPALEREHRCRYLDLRPVPGGEERTVVGDLNDPALVAEAVRDQEAVLFLAMGTVGGDARTVNNPQVAFAVNVHGVYTVIDAALAAGVRRVCFASSLSVYRRLPQESVDENRPPDAWQPYGLTKRLGENICAAAAQTCPDATIIALRLIRPRNEADWPRSRYDPANARNTMALGPDDTRRLFLAALALDRPGYHVVQATGDVTDTLRPNHRVRALLGWSPQNR